MDIINIAQYVNHMTQYVNNIVMDIINITQYVNRSLHIV